jgi:hypothetical protein
MRDNMNMNTHPSDKPWYRHLWPWLIMAPPCASVIGGVALAWAAIVSNDGVVTPDYARHGVESYARLTPSQAANCAVKDRACMSLTIKDDR